MATGPALNTILRDAASRLLRMTIFVFIYGPHDVVTPVTHCDKTMTWGLDEFDGLGY
jgi:hypothetical protein